MTGVGAALALAAAADDGSPELCAAWSLVDAIGWAASDREVDAIVREVGAPGSPWAATGQAAEAPGTLYAAEAELVDGGPFGPHAMGLSVREAVVWRNPSRADVRSLVLRVFGNGQDQNPDGARLRGVWVDNRLARATLDGTLLHVELPRPVRPGERVRMLLLLDERVPEFVPASSAVGGLETAGVYGLADGAVNLGWFLPLLVPIDRLGRFDARPLRPAARHAMYGPAAFHVVLDVPERYGVATTGVETLRREQDGSATVVAVAAGARDFAAMLVPRASVSELTVDGVHLRVFSALDDPHAGADLLSWAQTAVHTYGRQFGPMDQRELDVVEAPLRGVPAVAFPGLVAIDAAHQGGPYHRTAALEWTVAREVARQWWGVDVGSDPALEPWLDEGLASWAAALYWAGKYGEDAVSDRYSYEVGRRLELLRDRGAPDLPADLPSWKYDEDQYVAIVQGRASLLFEQVRALVGDEALFTALHAYHAAFTGRFATATDLVDALASASPDPAVQAEVRAAYARWIREGHGYEDLLGE